MNIPPKYEDLVLKVAELEWRESSLLESLTDKREEYNKLGDRYDALQQRLTVAERRNTELARILRSLNDCTDWWGWGVDESLRAPVEAALKLAEEGEGS